MRPHFPAAAIRPPLYIRKGGVATVDEASSVLPYRAKRVGFIWESMVCGAVSNLENQDDKLGGPQGESLVRSAVKPVSEASGVSQLRK